jgi:hypothetical protein
VSTLLFSITLSAAPLVSQVNSGSAALFEQEIDSVVKTLVQPSIVDGKAHHGGKGPCEEINVTDDQKKKILAAKFNLKRALVPVEGRLKIERINFVEKAFDEAATSQDIDPIINNVAAASGELAALKAMFYANVMFEIFEPAQRPKVLACLHAHRGHRKH